MEESAMIAWQLYNRVTMKRDYHEDKWETQPCDCGRELVWVFIHVLSFLEKRYPLDKVFSPWYKEVK